MIANLKTERKGRRERKGYKSQAYWFVPWNAHIPGRLQGITAAVLYLSTQGNFTALQGTLLSLTSLLLANLAPSCTRTFFLSMPDHSSVTNYHCQEAISSIFPAQTASYLTYVKHVWNSYHAERKKGRENKKKFLVCVLLRSCLKRWILKIRHGSCHTEVIRSLLTAPAAKILLLFLVVALSVFRFISWDTVESV